jgi:hypothetical protein
MSDFYAYNLADQTLVELGQSVTPMYGIGDEMSWSSTGGFLAYTLTSTDGRSDAWVYRLWSGEIRPVTNTGDAIAGGFLSVPGMGESLWVSRVGDQPRTYQLVMPLGARLGPYTLEQPEFTGMFQPVPSPDGKHVIYWKGTMGTPGGHWSFSGGGMLYVADVTTSGGNVKFTNERQLFPTLVPGRDAFQGGRVVWGPDSDAFAVWNLQWGGLPQPQGFPDPDRVYFGHLSTPALITSAQALDPADTAGALSTVDVSVAPDGNHLTLTMLIDAGSEGGEFGPVSELRMVSRGYGTDADKVTLIGQKQSWNGPAVYQPAGGR